uniref:Uncharacterized protein n=1 Tax=Rhizophora mucronata TaxID=61149 RepID=A0A2P2QEP7_RHIMU
MQVKAKKLKLAKLKTISLLVPNYIHHQNHFHGSVTIVFSSYSEYTVYSHLTCIAFA